MKAKLLAVLMLFAINLANSQPYEMVKEVDSTVLINLQKQVDDLLQQNQANSERINTLITSKDLDSKLKYEIVKGNLKNGLATFKLLNEKINFLKSRQKDNKLDAVVKDLHNPQSNSLNFKFDEVILELVKQHIQPKSKNVAGKILQSVNEITKSPILGSIPTIAPAISISNAVLGLLRSTSIFNDDVDYKKIDAFEKDLHKYIQYYLALNESTSYFMNNVELQTNELGILQQKLYDQLLFFSMTLKYPNQVKSQEEDIGEYMTNLFNHFNNKYVEDLLENAEKMNTNKGVLSYDNILISNNGNLKEANNRLEEFIALINQFEFQYNNYININEQYYKKVLNSLDIAQQNGIASADLVEKKKKEIIVLKEDALKQFKISINLPDLLLNKQSIKYTARIL
ncbi:hypothetical protein [Sphingobacterium cellulitidis]|uniref:Uncharacterized protein n=1 Tax=Sphingobacterium cellulitidis TaxID=1768011 RepID=A0A8H9G198_9SPHI|nr:hypothetical protein [Sphingobacterium soli]MBA8985909.1 hypothetical protein [Sphingobacterium soli]GGE28601.1 hypothetical protein GCM10011516_27880 [Sphingobacterium soli]